MSNSNGYRTELKTLYRNEDKLYEIIREIPIHNFYRKDGTMVTEYFNGWKNYLNADHVLKTPTHFIFCIMVTDAIIESEEQC